VPRAGLNPSVEWRYLQNPFPQVSPFWRARFTVETLEQHLGKPWKILAAVALGYPAYVPKGPWNGRPRKSVDEVAEFLR